MINTMSDAGADEDEDTHVMLMSMTTTGMVISGVVITGIRTIQGDMIIPRHDAPASPAAT